MAEELNEDLIRSMQKYSPLFRWAMQVSNILPLLLVLFYKLTASILGVGSAFGLTVTVSDIDLGVFLSVLFWAGMIYLICRLTESFGVSFSSMLFTLQTGIIYTQNRVAFAKAGGFDSNSVSTALSPIAALGLYWWGSTLVPNPLSFICGGSAWGIIITIAVIKLLIQTIWLIVSCQIFKRRY